MSQTLHKHQLLGASSEEGSSILMTQQSNAQVLAICYAQGWCSKPYKMTYAEASAVTSIGLAFQSSAIKSFNEFKYFTGITSLEQRAFQSCSSLTSIEFPNSLTSLPLRVCYNCPKLAYVYIPSSVTSVAEYAFSQCAITKAKWNSSIVPQGNIYLDKCREYESDVYSVIDGVLYNGNVLFAFPRAYNKNNYIFQVPSNVTSLGAYSINSSSTVKEIIINEGCTTLNQNTIQNCSALTTLTLPSTLTTINARSVYQCNKLETINVYSQQAPTCTATYAMSTIGSSATGTKTIHTLPGATGFTAAKWTALESAGWTITGDLT